MAVKPERRVPFLKPLIGVCGRVVRGALNGKGAIVIRDYIFAPSTGGDEFLAGLPH